MAWALRQQIVKDPSARHVLLCLASYASEGGKAAFPSVSTLSSETGLSERTVQRKLDELVKIGVIVRGNQKIAEAYIGRADRRPICYDIREGMEAPQNTVEEIPDGVTFEHERGVTMTPGESNGVSPCHERGVTMTPNTSFNPLRSKPSSNSSETDSLDMFGDEGQNLSPASKAVEGIHVPDGFDEWYQRYPRHEARENARKAWKRLTPTEREKAAQALPKYIASVAGKEKQYIALASTWLNGKRWEDDFLPPSPPQQTNTRPASSGAPRSWV